MRRIVGIERGGAGAADAADDAVRLDFDQRNRRRMVFTTLAGRAILLSEPRAVHLRDGDLLRLEDGAAVRVEAVPEPLIEIAAPSAAALVRIAWHLGNRHLPTQLVAGVSDDVGGGTIRIRHDHVIADMAAGLGGTCRPVDAPFDPEGGAYADGTGHAHAHAEAHGHAGTHGHAEAHSHSTSHSHSATHRHG